MPKAATKSSLPKIIPTQAQPHGCPVMAEKNLTISSRRIEIDGGFRLRGVSSDKDLSYGALLAADRDEYQADMAAEIFKTR